jgi:hypothetical protein
MEKVVTVDDKIHIVISDQRSRVIAKPLLRYPLVSYFDVIVKTVFKKAIILGGAGLQGLRIVVLFIIFQ